MFVYCLQVYAAIYEYKRSSLAVANISKKMSEHLPCNCLNVRMFPRQKHRLLGRLDVCLREKGGAEHPQCDSCDPGPIVQQNKQREAGEEEAAAGPEGRALDTTALDPPPSLNPPTHPTIPSSPPLLFPPIQPTPLT